MHLKIILYSIIWYVSSVTLLFISMEWQKVSRYFMCISKKSQDLDVETTGSFE